ncbi:MAG TPA: hypothetical protein VI298_05345, partial [Geobacteraceae bacterium]
MPKISRTTCRLVVLALSLVALCAATALAKEKAKAKGGAFDFAKTNAFVREIETRPDFPVSM